MARRKSSSEDVLEQIEGQEIDGQVEDGDVATDIATPARIRQTRKVSADDKLRELIYEKELERISDVQKSEEENRRIREWCQMTTVERTQKLVDEQYGGKGKKRFRVWLDDVRTGQPVLEIPASSREEAIGIYRLVCGNLNPYESGIDFATQDASEPFPGIKNPRSPHERFIPRQLPPGTPVDRGPVRHNSAAATPHGYYEE